MWATFSKLPFFRYTQYVYTLSFLPLILALGALAFDPTDLFAKEAEIKRSTLTVYSEEPSFSLANRMTLFTFISGSETKTFLTRAPSVSAALAEQNIKVSEHLLVPGPETKLDGKDITVELKHGIEVEILDEAKTYFSRTISTDPRIMAKEAGVTVYPEDKVYLMPPALVGKIIVKIDRATPFRLIDGGNETIRRTFALTISEFLHEKGIHLGDRDKISPSVATAITKNMVVTITRISDREEIAKESIAYETVYQDDNSMFIGQAREVQTGVDGQKEIKYKVTIQDGKEVGREIVEEKIIVPPTPRIIKVGTRGVGYDSGVVLAADDGLYFRAGAAYGVPWQVLSAIHATETGRSGDTCRPNWAGSGAMGPMQFMPGTFNYYAVDADGNGANICSVADSVYTAAHFLSVGNIYDRIYQYGGAYWLILQVARQLGWNG